MQQLGIGRKGDGLRLNRGVDRDALEVLAAQRAGLVRHPQALGQQELQLVAEPLAPMAQVASLVREVMLEKLFASEELEMSTPPRAIPANSRNASPAPRRAEAPIQRDAGSCIGSALSPASGRHRFGS